MAGPTYVDRYASDVKWRWSLRAFFSADLVGSTSLKHAPDHQWVRVFEGFYADFHTTLRRLWKRQATMPSEGQKPRLALWKVNGDELLYTLEVRNATDVVDGFRAFSESVSAYNASARTSANRKIARQVRGTMWLAGFPLRNRFVSLPVGHANREDYIGPDVDLGFRLTKFPRHRPDFLLLSPHAAEFLLRCLKLESEGEDIVWTYAGRSAFEGIHGGQPVPVVAVRLSRRTAEDRLLGQDDGSINDIAEVVREHVEQDDFLNGIPPFVFHDDRLRPLPAQMEWLERRRTELFARAMASEQTYAEFGRPSDQRSGGGALPPLPDALSALGRLVMEAFPRKGGRKERRQVKARRDRPSVKRDGRRRGGQK